MDNRQENIDWDKLLDELEKDHTNGKSLDQVENDLYTELKTIRNETYDLLEGYKNFDTANELLKVKNRIRLNNHKSEKRLINIKIYGRIAAAIAIITFSFVLYFSNSLKNTITGDDHLLKSDIGPGKQGATLTLASGKQVKLTDATNGELAREAGVTITKSARGQLIYEIKNADLNTNQINVLTTAKGETYQVRLPDGSLVFLNAASSLRYPTNFASQKTRFVSLTGEAYFEISKDKEHPFIVESGKQRVEVLGTKFNINSYEDEPAIKTTLLEGQVKIAPLKAMLRNTGGDVVDSKILRPGDQSSLQSEMLIIRKVDIAEATAWKNGEFLFNEDDFHTVMRKLARWYDVEIVYDVSAPEKFKLGGFIARDKNISAVLKLIELTGDVHFIIEGRRITVTK